MASMEDLIATISGGMHVGKQANDLKDLQATLSDTLNGTIPSYRAVPAPVNKPTNHIRPAPASSWNSPPPANSFLSSGAFAAARQKPYPSNSSPKASAPAEKQPQQQQEKKGSTPIQNQDQNRPYYAGFLPEPSSPPTSDGFANDAFKPLWSRENHSPNNGGFTKSR